ncbi:MAG: ABC transporter ATP-binding protein [Clostridiaceae bacterium]|nr:ABC transporter ATP-binding protein [Clostridiaceae bacterium]
MTAAKLASDEVKSTDPVIEVDHVSFAYNQNLVLDDVSLTVMPGEFVSLLGANGSGKSTLLKILLGELAPLSGTVKLLGRNPHHMKNWSRIGYVAQNRAATYSGFPATVEEVVLAHLYESIGLLRLPGRKTRDKAYNALELVGMQDFVKRPIGELSGGQQQRVLLARAMVASPELVLLDEPTTGVDAANAEAHFELLARLNKETGLTILVVTHDMAKSAEHVRRSFCLEDGTMVCLAKEQMKIELAHRHQHPDHHHSADDKLHTHVHSSDAHDDDHGHDHNNAIRRG